MTWFRVDDGFSEHPKVDALGQDTAYALAVWLLCGCASARALTDGVVTEVALARSCAAIVSKNRARGVAALVKAGLWEPVEGGWRFHQWDEHQPTRADVRRAQEQGKARKETWKARKRTEKELERNAVPPTSSDRVENIAPTRPDPTRPDERESDARDRGNASLVKPMSAAEMLAQTAKVHPTTIQGLGETARKLVIAGFERRKMAPPTACDDPMHPYWADLHKWAAKTVRLTGEDPEKLLKITIRAFLNDPRAGEVGQTLAYLVTNPQQYLNIARKDAA